MRKKNKKCFKYKKFKYITANCFIKKNKKIVVNNIEIGNLSILETAYKYKKLKSENE